MRELYDGGGGGQGRECKRRFFNTEDTEDSQRTQRKSKMILVRVGADLSVFFVCEIGVGHRSAPGIVNRSPNMIVNWFAAGLQNL